MYQAFFGFKEQPFAISPDPSFLYFSESHRGALNQLKFGINQKTGFMVLCGEVGTGKTTLCKKLMADIREDSRFKFALILNPRQTETELLHSILRELGEKPGNTRDCGELQRSLQDYLERQNSEGNTVILIVDEAQNMTVETLEQLRLLSNFETEKSKLMQIILVGQPELRDLLGKKELRQLHQRIEVSCRLTPFAKQGTHSYIHHRLAIAKAEMAPEFSRHALDLIHRRSRGVPRLINRICDKCLLSAFSKAKRTVNWADARRASKEALTV
jgi:general secretion pathway protein A